MSQTNPSKVYVGNLPYSTTEEELKELFSLYGEVSSVQIIISRQTGRATGFAFVTYNSPESAQTAIAKLNGFEFPAGSPVARQLKVDAAHQQRSDGERGGDGGRARKPFRRNDSFGRRGGMGGMGGRSDSFRDRDRRHTDE